MHCTPFPQAAGRLQAAKAVRRMEAPSRADRLLAKGQDTGLAAVALKLVRFGWVGSMGGRVH